jgi:hypothetical protein
MKLLAIPGDRAKLGRQPADHPDGVERMHLHPPFVSLHDQE